jgi:DNA-binding SARP family transcriptional activator
LPAFSAPSDRSGENGDKSAKKTADVVLVIDKRRYLKIFTLGKFQVVRYNGTPLEKRQWGGNRTRLLLKSILVHGLREIPKDIIIEDIWPESSPGSALQNFKVTLHRLRKCLEPDLKKHGRSAFIHLSGNRISLDADRCYVDVQEFLQCCKDIKRAALTKETRTILQLGQRVMDLYRGDFLPEDPYASWTEMKRLAIKDEYLTVLMVMTDIYQEQGQVEAAIQCCRLAISADICLENATGKLMQIFVAHQRRNDAISLYQRFQSALKSELGVDPDPAIIALYHQIRRETPPNSPTTD